MADCLIAFGSNQGDSRAIHELVTKSLESSADIDLIAASSTIRTVPVGGSEGQNEYLNGVFRIRTKLDPRELHRQLMRMELKLGRAKRDRWDARIVDLDLLLFGDQIIAEQDLTVPHPRMSFRRFVLEPASKIAAEMVHPDSGLSINELLDRINQRENHLLWVSDRISQSRAIADQCGDILSDWSIEFVDSLPKKPHPIPKLVVREVGRQSLPTHAPILDVTGYSVERILIEIDAAIKAITTPAI